MYAGIDYGMGVSNIDSFNGIRYGFISANSLSGDVMGDAEPIYPDTAEVECPKCRYCFDVPLDSQGEEVTCTNEECKNVWELSPYEFDCMEPIGWDYSSNDPDYTTEYSESLNSVIVTKSPYYTYAPFCSPCAPGAGDLDSAIGRDGDDPHESNLPRVYCFDHDYFDEEIAPYVLFRVSDDSEVYPVDKIKWVDAERIAGDYESSFTFLFHAVSDNGIATSVYEVKGTRYYRAMEYTRDEEGITESGGYITVEKHHYMGQRYKGLFGPYESEVFYAPSE